MAHTLPSQQNALCISAHLLNIYPSKQGSATAFHSFFFTGRINCSISIPMILLYLSTIVLIIFESFMYLLCYQLPVLWNESFKIFCLQCIIYCITCCSCRCSGSANHLKHLSFRCFGPGVCFIYNGQTL